MKRTDDNFVINIFPEEDIMASDLKSDELFGEISGQNVTTEIHPGKERKKYIENLHLETERSLLDVQENVARLETCEVPESNSDMEDNILIEITPKCKSFTHIKPELKLKADSSLSELHTGKETYTDQEPHTKLEPQTEPPSHTEPKPDTEPQSHTEQQSHTEPEPHTQTEPHTEAGPHTELGPHSEQQPHSDIVEIAPRCKVSTHIKEKPILKADLDLTGLYKENSPHTEAEPHAVQQPHPQQQLNTESLLDLKIKTEDQKPPKLQNLVLGEPNEKANRFEKIPPEVVL